MSPLPYLSADTRGEPLARTTTIKIAGRIVNSMLAIELIS
ncbi:MAG: hypothetical protein J07HX5_00882 [halophilic archaeon J07HX5]|nr:MAG: hypothetical protein J07HX5_00882 [halophilic archaeon J07HX5]